MRAIDDLAGILHRIDGRGYKAYRKIRGSWRGRGFELHIDHVQGDPYATPSKVRLRFPLLPDGPDPGLLRGRTRRIALADRLARQVDREIRRADPQRRGSGTSGLLAIDSGGQEVLERTAVAMGEQWLEARLRVGLPARGRRVLGEAAAGLLRETAPGVVARAFRAETYRDGELEEFVTCIENQEAMREQLADRGLVAFVQDGALLPRASGASDRPLDAESAVAFRSPRELRVTLELPHGAEGGGQASSGVVSGLGIPEGVTLIVGGGYHGKSTLLRAIERGVYPHVPGDGREGVVTRADAVKIRAEDGRRVEAVDISPFIGELPGGRCTRRFRTEDASGSTSQAAGIVEALEMGARLLLLDEDTSATNFMVRDVRMQALVACEDEPITPFVDRVRELHRRLGVSTVIVMGGSGDYFDVADTVLRMRDYLPEDATQQARRIAEEMPTGRRGETGGPIVAPVARVPDPAGFDPSRGKRAVRIQSREVDEISFGTARIDLRRLEQLVDPSQTRAVGVAIHLLSRRFLGEGIDLCRAIEALDTHLDEHGLDVLDPRHRPGEHPGEYARPRPHEIAAAINRLRTLRIES